MNDIVTVSNDDEPKKEININKLSPAQRTTLIQQLLAKDMQGLYAEIYEVKKDQIEMKEEIEKANYNYKE